MTVPRALALLAVLAVPLGTIACTSADPANVGPTTPDANERNTDIVHQECVAGPGSRTVDVNGDGSPDITHVYQGGREVCRILDLNMDKLVDTFVYYAPDGSERRRESDYDRDGRADEIITIQNGVIALKERETNYDDRLDTWDYYENGRLARRERDADGDGIVDQWWQFDPNNAQCAQVARDENGDRLPDPGSVVDLCKKAGNPFAPASTAPAAPASATPTAPATPLEGPATGGPPAPATTPPGGAP